MKRSGFTLLEMLVTITILMTVLSISVSLYQNNIKSKGVHSMVKYLEMSYRERKERAVALQATAGLCIGPSIIRSFELHPVSHVPSYKTLIDSASTMGTAVSISATPSVSAAPCASNEQTISLTPYPDTDDWQGSITVQSGNYSRSLVIERGDSLHETP